jgi:hypothetical protein
MKKSMEDARTHEPFPVHEYRRNAASFTPPSVARKWRCTCNSAESYNGKEPKYRGAIMKVSNHKVEWRLEDVPFGDYTEENRFF